MTSREYFDQLRTAVADVRRAEETLDYWESRIDSLGGGSTGSCCGYRDPDRMTGKLSALWDARDRAERKLDGMVELQDEAIAVIGMVGDAGRASTSLWRDVLLDCDVCRAANNDMGCEDQRTMELQARVKKLVETGGLQ